MPGSTACDSRPDGRLGPAEFDERLDVVLAARIIDALASITADLIAAPGSGGALTLPPARMPAEPAAELPTIKERHGTADPIYRLAGQRVGRMAVKALKEAGGHTRGSGLASASRARKSRPREAPARLSRGRGC